MYLNLIRYAAEHCNVPSRASKKNDMSLYVNSVESLLDSTAFQVSIIVFVQEIKEMHMRMRICGEY